MLSPSLRSDRRLVLCWVQLPHVSKLAHDLQGSTFDHVHSNMTLGLQLRSPCSRVRGRIRPDVSKLSQIWPGYMLSPNARPLEIRHHWAPDAG